MYSHRGKAGMSHSQTVLRFGCRPFEKRFNSDARILEQALTSLLSAVSALTIVGFLFASKHWHGSCWMFALVRNPAWFPVGFCGPEWTPLGEPLIPRCRTCPSQCACKTLDPHAGRCELTLENKKLLPRHVCSLNAFSSPVKPYLWKARTASKHHKRSAFLGCQDVVGCRSEESALEGFFLGQPLILVWLRKQSCL